jgi:tetratricopeptide (TPR) repeat protein/tRNA A-37 threonylcarbamoyl transferase component Bud32
VFPADAAANCPELDELERLAAGEEVESHTRDHVSGCQRCQAALAEICACNTFLDQHRAALRSAVEGAAPVAPVIPGYRIVARIEAGGQGVVYKAVQTATHRKVAIKLLRDGVVANERQRFRFERETELLASLRHPNIVTLFDRGCTPDGHDYLVMEWVHGVPLDKYVRDPLDAGTYGQAGIRTKLTLFSKIAQAVQHAHGGSVIHRDLKPGNILVDDAGEPHIIDFGLARAELGNRGPLPTMTGDFAGTRAYSSPEQVAGKADQMRVTTDVYSLGVILYEMLTGAFPYPVDGSPSEIDRHIQLTEPRSPCATNPAIPDDVATIVLRALRKNAQERYATAGALAADIDDYLAGRPIAAKKDSTWYVLRRTLRRHRRTLATVSAATLAIILGIVGVVAYRVASSRAAAEQARAVAETEHAEALGLVLQSMGRPAVAPPDYAGRGFARLASQIQLGWLGDKRGIESATAALIAGVNRDAGYPEIAEEWVREANVQRQLELGPDYPETAQGLYELAEIILFRRRPAEAQRYCEQAIALGQRLHGDGGLDVARGRELLARIALARGDSATAARLAAEAAAVQIAQLGEESLDVARSRDTRAAVLFAAGDVASAEAECLRALRVRLTLLNDEHPAVAESLRRLATILEAKTGATAAAPSVPEGAADAWSAADLRALAAELEQLSAPPADGQTSAPQVLHRMLQLKEALLGPLHKALLSTLGALEVEAGARSDVDEMEAAYARAAAVIEATQGPQSLALADCLQGLGSVRCNYQGRYAAGLADFERAADIWWAVPADRRDYVAAAITERWLAEDLALAGEWDRAAAHYRHCIEVLRDREGPEHYAVVTARCGYGWVLLQQGRAAEGEQEARAALALGERLGALIPPNQWTHQRLFVGMTLAERGQFAEAQKLLEQAWDGEGADHGGAIGLPIPPNSMPARRLVEHMITICVAQGDAAGEAHWREILAAAGK